MYRLKEAIKTDFALDNRLECDIECYFIKKRRFLVFIDDVITRDNLYSVCSKIRDDFTAHNLCAKYGAAKTFIVVAQTNDNFKRADLELFDGVDTVTAFYLFNNATQKVIYPRSGPFMWGLSYTSIIKKIHSIYKSIYENK